MCAGASTGPPCVSLRTIGTDDVTPGNLVHAVDHTARERRRVRRVLLVFDAGVEVERHPARRSAEPEEAPVPVTSLCPFNIRGGQHLGGWTEKEEQALALGVNALAGARFGTSSVVRPPRRTRQGSARGSGRAGRPGAAFGPAA